MVAEHTDGECSAPRRGMGSAEDTGRGQVLRMLNVHVHVPGTHLKSIYIVCILVVVWEVPLVCINTRSL